MAHRYSLKSVCLVGSLIVGVVFALDTLIPHSSAPAIGYCAAVVLAGETGRRRFTIVFTAVCCALTWVAFAIEVSGFPAVPRWVLEFDAGMVTAVIGLTAGLAVLRQATIRHLEDRTAELARSNQELERFAATVSHDLRSPLLSISGSAKLLEEQTKTPLDPESRELLGYVQNSVRHMDELIGRMLHYARAAPARWS